MLHSTWKIVLLGRPSVPQLFGTLIELVKRLTYVRQSKICGTWKVKLRMRHFSEKYRFSERTMRTFDMWPRIFYITTFPFRRPIKSWSFNIWPSNLYFNFVNKTNTLFTGLHNCIHLFVNKPSYESVRNLRGRIYRNICGR